MTSQSSEASFLERLQQEAKLQSELQQRKFLPAQLDWLTSLIGNYPWQMLLLSSGLTALVWELIRHGAIL